MTAILASQIGLHGLRPLDYAADGALSLEPQVAVLDGTAATAQTTLAAPGAGMVGKYIIAYASNVDNACDVDFTDGSGARTITFGQINDAVIFLGLNATMWMVLQAPMGASFAPAITQTYSTADATHAARTAAGLTDNSGGTATTTLADVTEANNAGSADRVPTEDAIASLAAEIARLTADQVDTAQVLNSVVDALQAQGLLS